MIKKKELTAIDDNGTKYYNVVETCPRCAGAGSRYEWIRTGRYCYQCGGTGWWEHVIKEYTPEHRAKLDEQNAKRNAKRIAEQAKREAEFRAKREAEQAEREKKLKEEQAKIDADPSVYVGNVGDTIETVLTVETRRQFPARDIFGRETVKYVYNFRTPEKNVIVWFTSGGSFKVGDTVKVRAIVNEHKSYHGLKQTVVKNVRRVK